MEKEFFTRKRNQLVKESIFQRNGFKPTEGEWVENSKI